MNECEPLSLAPPPIYIISRPQTPFLEAEHLARREKVDMVEILIENPSEEQTCSESPSPSLGVL